MATYSLAELSRESWAAILTESFPHLKVLAPLDAELQTFLVRHLESDHQAILHLDSKIEETSAAHARLRARAHVEDHFIARLEDYGWMDEVFFAVLAIPAGAKSTLAEAMAEGKLSRVQLLKLRDQLRQAEAKARETGFILSVRPETVRLDDSGNPIVTSIWPAEAPSDDGWLTKDDLAGTQIGRYRLERLIGEGGFAEVYLAQQQGPLRRPVALKILKSGMDTRQIIGRFETERNLLALLDHPNIAKVYDAGATPAGQPFFAMEYVAGQPLTHYAREHRLTLNERLRLFDRVCQAMHHAHENGVIHRDLKPPNVLVSVIDGEPQIKIIDFGIAKVLGGPLGDHTLYTELNQFVGSPGYMSPEQAELGVLVDHRADIYALGAMLFELICGETPVPKERFVGLPHEAKVKLVRETSPGSLTNRLRHPARLNEAAQSFQISPNKLLAHSKRGLSEMVGKAVRLNPAERYASARQFGASVQSVVSGTFKRTPWWKKIPTPIVWSTVGALVTAAMAALLIHGNRKAEEAARRAAVPPAIDPPRLLQDPTRPPLVWIEPGTQWIGQGDDRRQVTFHHPFALGQFEVTRAEYKALFSAHDFIETRPIETNPSHFEEADSFAPVESVSWADATRYCAWINAIEYVRHFERLPSGYIYSLPMEDEWEFALRQGQLSGRTKRIVAKHFESPWAWHAQNSRVNYSGGFPMDDRFLEGLHGPQPVGRSYPNQLGLYDLQGNVAEWMHDFSVTPNGPLISNSINGPSPGSLGVVRGGSWSSDVQELDLPARQKLALDTRDPRIGFRVAAVHYETRAYAPKPRWGNHFGVESETVDAPKIVSSNALKDPVILDFETLPLGPVATDHPLFQAIGIEGIHIRSSDFRLGLPSDDGSDRFLWSTQHDQLEVVDSKTPGPFANGVDYMIAFKKPQTVIGVQLSEHANYLKIELGFDEDLGLTTELEPSENLTFYLTRNKPFNRLRISADHGISRSLGIDLAKASGFALKKLLLDRPPHRIEKTYPGHLATLAPDRETHITPHGTAKWHPVDLEPGVLGLTIVNGEWQVAEEGQGLQFRANSPDSPCLLTYQPSLAEASMISMVWNSETWALDDRFLAFGESDRAPLATFPLNDLPSSQENVRAIHLRTTQELSTIALAFHLREGETRTLTQLAVGTASRHEGWRLQAPHVPTAAVLGGGLLMIESNDLLERFFPNVRAVGIDAYLRHPATFRLPFGCLALQAWNDPERTTIRLKGTAIARGMAAFKVDDHELARLNASPSFFMRTALLKDRVPVIPLVQGGLLRDQSLPQSYHYRGVTLTMRRDADGSVALTAYGAKTLLEEDLRYRLIAGLSRDGVQRDWDTFNDPWIIDKEVVSESQGDDDQSYWMSHRTIACPLASDQPWVMIFSIEVLKVDDSNQVVSPQDWNAWQEFLGDIESLHRLKKP